MKCDLKNRSRLIADYLTGELAEDERATFEEHYFQCKTCFHELRVAEDAVNLIEEDGPAILTAQETRWSKMLKIVTQKLHLNRLLEMRDWAYAKSAVALTTLIILIGLSIAYFKFFRNPALEEPFAANFQKSTYFENLIQQTYQSQKLLSEVSPANDANFEDEILFRWQHQEAAKLSEPFELRILNNRGEELFRFTVEQNQLRFEKELSPGLYYWTLLTEDEMVYLGRFYVKKP